MFSSQASHVRAASSAAAAKRIADACVVASDVCRNNNNRYCIHAAQRCMQGSAQELHPSYLSFCAAALRGSPGEKYEA
jgi:hypothetical protein